MTRIKPLGVCAVISLLAGGAVTAEPAVYSGLAEFAAALPTEPTVLDFDRMPAGMTIEASASAGGITVEYDFDGSAMKVTHSCGTGGSRHRYRNYPRTPGCRR